MTPTLTASYRVVSSAANTTALVTPSFTPVVGEILVVKCVAEDNLAMGTPSGGSLTYTSQTGLLQAGNSWAGIWTTTTTSATSMTVTSGTLTAGRWHSMVVERWSGAQLAGTPATNSTKTGTGAPSSTIVTVASNSVVSFLDGDFAAVAPGTYTYRSSATDEGIHDVSGAGRYVAYYAWQTAAASGSQTFGLISPSGQTWTMLAIEIQDAGSAPTLPPELIMQTRRAY